MRRQAGDRIERKCSSSTRCRRSVAVPFCWLLTASQAFAVDKPPLSADDATPAVTTSKISAVVEFGLDAIDTALERKIPRRLASFEDGGRSCWNRRILGRDVNIDCSYEGTVDRTGPIALRAEAGKLNASMPLVGSVEGQGVGRFARLLHGTGEGAMMVYAGARPRLRPDWSVSLDMSEGFRWQQPPTLQILGFRINLTKYIEPRIRAQLSRVQGDVAKNIAALNIKAKAASAWKQAFAVVPIVDQPAIWLQTTPHSIAFSGVRAEGKVLEGSLEIAGTATTSVGAAPPANPPTPLPALGDEVSEPGRFEIIVPVIIDYAAIRQKLQDAATADPNGPKLSGFEIYPSAGKLVVGLRVGVSPTDSGDWVYLTATPKVDDATQMLQFPDLAFQAGAAVTAASDLAALMRNPAFIQQLQQRLSTGYQDERDRLIAAVNAKLTRPLADGFRSEGQLQSAGLANVQLLSGGLQINLRAAGRLKLLYGL
jgi:hypothetical protein